MFLRHNLPAILWGIVILVLCSFPGNNLPRISFNFIIPLDKVIHILIFGVFCFLLILGFTKQYTFKFLHTNPILFATVVSIFYGILIEVLQEYVFTGRSFELMDIVADSSGSFISILIYYILFKKTVL